MTVQSIDQQKLEAFGGRIVEVLNGGSLALMTSIGHQTGLFDVMASLPAASSATIARESGLNERYVREWLGAMGAGGIVSFEPLAGAYTLPPEHAAWLTRAAGPANLGAATQVIPLLAQVEQQVIDCFRSGGGVPSSAYPRFQRLMAEDSAVTHDAVLLEGILPLVPGLPQQLEAGITVADIGCGSGHAVNLIARAYPRSRVVGYDISSEGIATGRREAEQWGLTNASFELRDVTALEMRGQFDLVTAFDAIHDQAHPAQVLAGIARSLRPDGVFLMVDIRASSALQDNLAMPMAPFLYTFSTLHCMTVSLAQAGDGLGALWGEQTARQMLAEAGFADVEVRYLDADVFNSYYIARRTAAR